jgi:hypothetical protein
MPSAIGISHLPGQHCGKTATNILNAGIYCHKKQGLLLDFKKKHGSTLDIVLFQTVTSCPVFKRLLTIADPMVPSPRNPIFSGDAFSCLEYTSPVGDDGSTSGINC